MTTAQHDLSRWLSDKDFADFAAAKKQFDKDGYLIFENVLTPEELADIRAALKPHLDANIQGRNNFEGFDSNRVYALLAKGKAFADLATHPLALAFAEADLGENCLLSACLAINLHPGETVQPWHYDDGHMRAPRPRESWGVSAFWTIDDTTETNGATEILPGSHTWGQTDNLTGIFDASGATFTPEGMGEVEIVKSIMPAGSLMVAKGTLWHRGGANRSDKPRCIITPQYCVGWARQLENMVLAVPPEKAAALPTRAQELLGYSIHKPFMGYVDGMHPNRVLGGLAP